ncbi:MAG: sugar phosphate isomerase/epimerase [Proteobacteria bacterium]|nr:sugar phosphate isomerase/epimerase [Pseudomonadota bacterium]
MKLHRSLFALATAVVLAALPASAAPIPDDARINGFAIGCQSYSFNRFSVFDAIEKTAEAGGKTIEFYPGQILTKEERNIKWGHDASDEVIARVKEKLAKHGVRAVNYGVVGIPKDEAGARKVFEFAKKLGLYGITTESIDALDTAEKLAKEYDIRVGIHEHAKRMKKDAEGKQVEDPNYKIWNPEFVRDLVKNRDSRIGACADIGHWQTSGLKAVDCLKILEGRIISLHAKERAALGPGQHDTIFGTGITDMAGVLAELKRQKFSGNISLEYEYNWDNSVPDIKQCIDFVRNWKGK